MWTALPMPTEPKVVEASFFFAASMNSCAVFHGFDGEVIMTLAL